MKNKILSKILSVALSVVVLAPGIARAEVGQPDIPVPALGDVHCSSYCVYDKTTGEILISSNPDEKVYPASQTKIMTCMLALDYLDTDAYLTVSQNAMDNITSDSSVMGVKVGERVLVSELLYGLMLPSGNDAANVLAEGVVDAIFENYPSDGTAVGPDGVNASFFDEYITYKTEETETSESAQTPEGETTETTAAEETVVINGKQVENIAKLTAFAALMNLRASNLGLAGTHFVNASGLHDEDHYTTAHDLTLMIAEASENADFKTLISSPTHVFKATNLHKDEAWSYVKNTDYLLFDPWLAANTANGDDSHLAAIIGGKTGTTNAAGKCITLYSVNENGHDVMVSMCGVPMDYYFYTTMYMASIVAYGNLACWEADPVTRVIGTTGDYRTINAPEDEQPEYDSLQYPGDELVNYVEEAEEEVSGATPTPTPVPADGARADLALWVSQNRVSASVVAGLLAAIIVCNVALFVRIRKLKSAQSGRRKVRKSSDDYIR